MYPALVSSFNSQQKFSTMIALSSTLQTLVYMPSFTPSFCLLTYLAGSIKVSTGTEVTEVANVEDPVSHGLTKEGYTIDTNLCLPYKDPGFN